MPTISGICINGPCEGERHHVRPAPGERVTFPGPAGLATYVITDTVLPAYGNAVALEWDPAATL